jgi:hypothetical protein
VAATRKASIRGFSPVDLRVAEGCSDARQALNFIEQCWGATKQQYRLNPQSSSAADIEKNMLEALDSVDLKSMRK